MCVLGAFCGWNRGNRMIGKIQAYIERHALLAGEAPVLVGVSGGADSVALLALLCRLGYACVVAHCNFHLRGDESERDEAFVRGLAERWQIPFYRVDFNTEEYARKNRLSIEMAARQLRYEWFENLRQDLGCQAIAVAHHRDDNVETVLLNLFRGTGLSGLRGMRPRNGYVIRPLLGVSRQEIEAWLCGEGLSFVTDSTNCSDLFTRNFIRLRVLPLLESRQPSVKETIARSAEYLSGVEVIYRAAIDRARREVMPEEGRLLIDTLLCQAEPRTILFEILRDYGFSRAQVDQIFAVLEGESGRRFYSSTHQLVKDRGALLLAPLSVDQPDTVMIGRDFDRLDLPLPIEFCLMPNSPDLEIVKSLNVAYLDYGRLRGNLLLRHWQEGDWFIPFGMRGRKKLSDYFSDHKFSRLAKEEQWLLCDEESIVWVVGQRIDDRYRIKAETEMVLRINFYAR